MAETAENEGLSFIQDSLNNMANQTENDTLHESAPAKEQVEPHTSAIEQDSAAMAMKSVCQEDEEGEEKEEEEHEDKEADQILEQREYDNINEVREAAIRYGKKHKFAVATLRSGERQLILVCKHAGEYRPAVSKLNIMRETSKKGSRVKKSQRIKCPFEIRAKPFGGKWVIHKIHIDHNHEMAQDIRVYSQHRRLTSEIKKEIIGLIDAKHKNTEIKNILIAKGYENFILKDIANIRTLRNKQLKNLLPPAPSAPQEDIPAAADSA